MHLFVRLFLLPRSFWFPLTCGQVGGAQFAQNDNDLGGAYCMPSQYTGQCVASSLELCNRLKALCILSLAQEFFFACCPLDPNSWSILIRE